MLPSRSDLPQDPASAVLTGWKRKLSADDLHEALESLARRPKSASDWPQYYARAVDTLRLPGHDAGINPFLAEAQIQADFSSAARFAAIWRAIARSMEGLHMTWARIPEQVDLSSIALGEQGEVVVPEDAGMIVHSGWSFSAFLRSWHDFTSERICIRVQVPELQYSGGLCWGDVRPYLPRDSWRWWESLDEQADVDTGHMHELNEAFVAALGGLGLMRGPCQACGFARWPVPWREKSRQGGRRPLSDSLCPACEVMQVRRRDASRKRTELSKKRDRRAE